MQCNALNIIHSTSQPRTLLCYRFCHAHTWGHILSGKKNCTGLTTPKSTTNCLDSRSVPDARSVYWTISTLALVTDGYACPLWPVTAVSSWWYWPFGWAWRLSACRRIHHRNQDRPRGDGENQVTQLHVRIIRIFKNPTIQMEKQASFLPHTKLQL